MAMVPATPLASGSSAATPTAAAAAPATPAISVSSGSDPATPATLALPKADIEFTCAKCGETCSVSVLSGGAKGTIPKNPVEHMCGNTYKCLAKRWKKSPQLKVWYQKLTEEERKAWYIKHKRLSEHGQGTKRDFETELVSTTEVATGAEKRRRFMWQPYSQFEQSERLRNPQATKERIDQAWRLKLLSGGESGEPLAKKFDGEWHLKVYIGIIEDEVDSQMDRRALAQKTGVADEAALLNGLHAQAEELDILRAQRLLARPAETVSGPSIPDEYVKAQEQTGFGEQASQGGVASLLQRYAHAATAAKELQKLYMEEAADAEQYQGEVTKDGRGTDRFSAEKEVRKAMQKVAMAADECILQSEQVVHHIKTKEFAGAGLDEEWASAVAEVESNRKALADRRTAFEAFAAGVQGEMLAAIAAKPPKDIDGLKTKLTDEAKAVVGGGSELAKLRKTVNALKSMLNKRASGSTKMSKADKLRKQAAAVCEVEEDTCGYKSLQFLFNHTWVQNDKSDINVYDDASYWHKGEPVRYEVDKAIMTAINGNKAFCAFLKWYAGFVAKNSEPTPVAGLNNPSLARFLKNNLSKQTDLEDELFEKPMFLDKSQEELNTAVFDMQHWSAVQGSGTVIPCAFGCAEVRLTLSGQMLHAGIKYDPNECLAKQLADLMTISGTDMAKITAQAPNFLCVTAPGTILAIPAGYLVASWSPQYSTGLRWAVTVGQRDGETDIIRSMVAALLEAYPGLHQSLYPNWLQWLQAQAGAPIS